MPGGLDMLRDVLLWWARQLLALLPRGWRSDAAQADALLVCVDDDPGASGLRLVVRRRRQESPLGTFHLDEAGERAARAALRQRPRRVILRPGPHAVLQRPVVLPLAAEREVTRVLRYEMDRLTPFTADEIFWSAAVQRRDRSAGRLELHLTLVPKMLLQPVLAALLRIGVTPGAIEATGRGVQRHIDLSPPSSDRRRALSIATAAVLILAVAAAVTPFVTQTLASRAIEARIAALQPQLDQVAALRHRLAAGTAGNDAIAAERARNGDALQVLATVTDLMPDDTVLGDLSLRQGKLDISGRSLAAAQLIPAMAADPTLRNPSFAAPVTRSADGKADTFVIRAEQVP
jgi:general secretion pathway protein L